MILRSNGNSGMFDLTLLLKTVLDLGGGGGGMRTSGNSRYDRGAVSADRCLTSAEAAGCSSLEVEITEEDTSVLIALAGEVEEDITGEAEVGRYRSVALSVSGGGCRPSKGGTLNSLYDMIELTATLNHTKTIITRITNRARKKRVKKMGRPAACVACRGLRAV